MFYKCMYTPLHGESGYYAVTEDIASSFNRIKKN